MIGMSENSTQKKQLKPKNTKYPQLKPLWAAIFSDVLGYSLFIPLLPSFVQAFGATNIQLGLLLATNAAFTLIFGPIFGKLSDKYGRKPMLIISQAGTLTGFLIFAFAKNMGMLYLSRAMDGIFGGTLPVAKAMIGDVVRPRDRSIQMTNVGVCYNISNLFGPALGGILSKSFGLIGPGLTASALSLFTLIQITFFLKESAPIKTGKVLWNVNSGENDHPVNNGQNPHQGDIQNTIDMKILKNRTAMILLIQWGFHSLAFVLMISGLPLFAYLKFGIDEQEIGILFSIAGIFQLIIRYSFFYPMLRKIGDLKTGKIGLGIYIFSFFIMGFVGAPYQLIMIMLVNSFSTSCARGVLQSFISRTVHPKVLGKVMGIHSAIENVSQIIGPIMITSILTFWNINLFGVVSSMLSVGAFILIFMKLEFKFERN
jgi:DHA1 family tetracycline resistance protein-like MFS transporter